MLSCLRPSYHIPLRRFFCKNSAPDMERYREAFARRMAMAGLKPHHRIALGVSGGPDSMALCVLAAAWKSDGLVGINERSGFIDGLLGIIVDHRLRPESTEEANQVRDRVSKMGIRCTIACCDWSEGRPKQGHLQEAARDMRYQIFQGVCIEREIGVLLIAHHSDDQAELFILRLSRNSGVLGLAGMAFASQLFPTHLHYCGENPSNRGILLVRPMLHFSKYDIYKICQTGCQEWVEDPTNQSLLFARNRIRISLRNLSSCIFKSELQALISACRLTRSFIYNICYDMIKQSVSIMDHGYAIIDLKKLNPSHVEDLCLSKFLAMVLQFVSQRHRPIRGSVSQLLLDYFRNLPCKTSLTAAGCYLCAAPGSKGTKILVCCSLDSPQPSRTELSHECSCGGQNPCLLNEIDQIIMDAKSYSVQSVDASNVPFLHVNSSDAILEEAKRLNIIGESTYRSTLSLQMEEFNHFTAKTEVKYDQESRHELKSTRILSIPLHSGQLCHFMSRFLVTWKFCKNISEDGFSTKVTDFNWDSKEGNHYGLCGSCIVGHETIASVRPMVDADWLYLANLSKCQTLEECQENPFSSMEQDNANTIPCTNHMRVSAQKALQVLKSIPVAARRGLPVLVDPQGLPLSIPSICFQRCPYISVLALFKPRVPLGGGYSSYI